jgi:hypothetical protein
MADKTHENEGLVLNWDRKRTNQLREAIEIACESTGAEADPRALDQISDFAVAMLRNPLPDYANPFTKENWNLTKQIELERANPALAKALEMQAQKKGN